MRANSNQVDYVKLGQRIREIRENQNMRQALLAEKIGSTGAHISNIETAATKVSLPVVIAIANALHCTMDDLIRDSLETVVEAQKSEVSSITDDCTQAECEMLIEQMRNTKQYVRKYLAKVAEVN